MRLEGIQEYNSSPARIWSILMDPPTLAKITPGISRLEAIGRNEFLAFADVKIGPVKGSFKGNVQLFDIDELSSFSLKVQQKSKIGNVDAKIQIDISDKGQGVSEISFKGDALLSGLIARTGQRVLSGVTRTLTNQFFEALGQEIKKKDVES